MGVFATPFALTLVLLAMSWLPRIQASDPLVWSFWIAAAVLLAWQAVLAVRARTTGAPALVVTRPRAQHYIQSVCQLAVYVYWGWFWPPVFDFAPLLLGQLVFAYVFDILLTWSRRQPFALGFGPFPIIFSTNLFLWFRDEWFALQFLMIAVGFLGKAFIRWERDGRLVHIFNPSAFTLAVFSLGLLATGTTGITWGQEIATTFSLGTNVYMVVFLVGLIVMYFFAITPVTASAAATLFAASAVYSAATGVPYFVDSEIPSAVFLGLHLLVTDPSTSPRTPLGRGVFGVMYGLGVVALYALLRQAALRAAPQPGGPGHRPRGAGARPAPARQPAWPRRARGHLQPAAHGGLDDFLRRHDAGRPDRRDAQGRCAAVLAAGVRGGPAAGVRAPDPHHVLILRG